MSRQYIIAVKQITFEMKPERYATEIIYCGFNKTD